MQTGTYTYHSYEDLMRVLETLARTAGVTSFSVHPSPPRVTYQHQNWAKVDLLVDPSDVDWEERLRALDLSRYVCKSLLGGVIQGSIELRRRMRFPTHLLCTDRSSLMQQLFPNESWTYAFYDHQLFGLTLVEVGPELSGTRVLVCGGPVDGGTPFQADMGLLLEVRRQ